MTTELEYIYAIREVATKHTSSDDERLNERVLRAFLHTHRPKLLDKYSKGGHTISDECFQHLGELEFDYLKPKQFTRQLPKFVRLDNRFGLFLQKNGENVPVCGREEFDLGLKNPINGRLPKAKMLDSVMTIYIGNPTTTTCGQHPSENTVINDFAQDIIDNVNKITVNVYGVLVNPDDAPGYDFTFDPFPFPAEFHDDLVSEILRKEFNILLQVKPDKVTDGNSQPTPDAN